MEIKDLIWLKHNSLSVEFCNHTIEKFDRDSRKTQGVVSGPTDTIVDKSIKSSMDLVISEFPDWKEEDKVFYESLQPAVEEYIDYCKELNEFLYPYYGTQIKDIGYQIQRTEPGEFYRWHHDFLGDEINGARALTFIWYLNDITDEGYTEFIDGTRIQPETGKLLIFPATWTYTHRGVSPKSETKYICTGWIYNKQ